MPKASNITQLPVEPLATIQEAAAYLRMPVATLYAWRHKGFGPKAAKIGKHLRYDWPALRAFYAEQQNAA